MINILTMMMMMTSIRFLYRVPQLINVLYILRMCKRPIFSKVQVYDLVCFISINSFYICTKFGANWLIKSIKDTKMAKDPCLNSRE